ncbi:Multidrug resistance-associated protein 1 [Babesia sp. Xinjiang]|uniref:Multidrug resistance-associated protein 1 n=1 Tax=Babesia sp. Xinjiang TaxID=462227 RepID=UPI000A25AB66|nr:Multidrug resistance-associated protein 1 [Babesia sp. Xinjiang]ORM41911.1 Multidrug resistance-associated protein 1 [Babesia sp. Xinjiang]
MSRQMLFCGCIKKGCRHRKEFPGGPPPQYYPGLAPLDFGVRMGSGWVKAWVKHICSKYIRPEAFYRLPEADQISYWQPTLSRHVSDGLIQLEKAEAEAAGGQKDAKCTKPYRSIMLRAILLTFWRRILLTILVMIMMTATTAGTVMLLKHLMTLLSQKYINWLQIVLFVLAIVGIEIFNTFLDQHANLYNVRLQNIMEASISITLFQHGFCHRRDFPNLMAAYGVRQGCKGTLHSGTPMNDGDCEMLACPARRHQNNELPPSMYTFMFVDTFYIVSLVDATVMLVRFVSNMTLGMVLIHTQIGMSVFYPMIIILGIILVMILVEVVNGCNIIHALQSKDDRLSKSSDVVGSLKLLEMVGLEDIGYNVVQNSRSDELVVLRSRLLLFSINRSLMRLIGAIVYLAVILDFIRNIKAAGSDLIFDVSVPITLLYIVNTVVGSFDHLLKSLKVIVEGVAATRRVETYVRTCSPNFYLTNRNSVTGIVRESLLLNLPKKDATMDKNTLVVFKDASFCWINKREDALKPRGEESPMFTSVNFELRRGDITIITGNQGCGKTSFLKAVLGEMSLVSGSMAVAPLSAGMPIFYSSQDVWLPRGTIRSIITFGHQYDEEVYSQVVRSAELDTDFKQWADGDMRKVSEQGFSLSGGQRVRISLARALYAYVMYSKANEKMEDRCCFLVCLDEPFNGLDPNVTLSIFNNLFDKDTGLLIRDDVAVVMTFSKSVVTLCSAPEALVNTAAIYIQHITGDRLCNKVAMGKETAITPKPTQLLDGVNVDGPETLGRHDSLMLSHNFLSAHVDADESIESAEIGTEYEEELASVQCEEQNKKCWTWPAYKTYISAMGTFYIIAVVVTLTAAVTLDKVFGILVANWSDSIKSLEGRVDDMKGDLILEKHEGVARDMGILVPCFVALVFVGMFIAVFANVRASRKIHEFIMNSIFHKTASELKLKDSLARIVTFLSSDIYYIDEHVGRFIVATLFAFLNICTQFMTICYAIPIISPIPVAMVILLYVFVVRNYLVASKKLQWVMLEANNSINAVYGDVISGSDIYRSFRKEHLCIKRVCTNSENYFGIKFLKVALTTWAMLTCKLLIVFMILCASFIPAIYGYIRGDELKVAQIGLGISYSLGLNVLLNAFILNFSLLEKQMCSMVRFKEYFLQGKASLGDVFDRMVETVMVTSSFSEYLGDNQKRWGGLVRRRKAEYRNFMFRRYTSLFTTYFYRPKLEFLDSAFYFPGDHSTLELRGVSVTVESNDESNGGAHILKNVNATASVGDIIGIVGRTGAGKTTLLGTLRNIGPRREGSVLLDGRDLSSIPRSVLRHVVGVLPQTPFIFKGWTLRRFLDPRMLYSDDEIINALECCGLQELVKTISGGNPLDNVLVAENVRAARGLYLLPPLLRLKRGRCSGDTGELKHVDTSGEGTNNKTGFSPNQLRHLSFARLVLYRKTYRILLIDEPPAENCVDEDMDVLDTAHESHEDVGLPIYDLVKMYFRHCTTFIVAHNKNALRACTSVWVMSNGMLVRECPAAEFMANGRAMMENMDLYLSKMLFCGCIKKGCRHRKEFPGGPPPQYYPGLAPLDFGVRMGSGIFDAVWPATRIIRHTYS